MSTGITNTHLGRLENVELESVWPHEAHDFTPWLVQPQNLRILAETLGMELEPEAEEVAVGPFAADILCRDSADGSWVVIENQIKKTDHTHLGQILTYAAGLGARTLIWVAAKFTEEHRATLDWLNENTVENVSVFGLEIELWRIGDSAPAPKFNIVSQPNDWSKAVKAGAGASGKHATPLKQVQFGFWTAFKAYLEQHTKLRCRKPAPQHWLTLPIGQAGFHLSAVTSTWNSVTESYDSEIRAEFVLCSEQAKEQFRALEGMKETVQAKIDLPLTWHNSEMRKSAKVYVRRDADFTNQTLWPEQCEWLARYLNLLAEVFTPLVKGL